MNRISSRALALAIGWVFATLQMTGANAQSQPPADVFNDAKALGKTKANAGAQEVRSGSTVTLTPSYTANPPQRSIYSGGGNATSQLGAQQASCQSNPNDPLCAGVSLGSTQQPRMTIAPSDPALAGQSAAANPTLVLGDIANSYSACTQGPPTLVSPAQYSNQSCSLNTQSWQPATCVKNLTVVPHTRTTCQQGTWFNVAWTSFTPDVSVGITAYCDISAAQQKYQVHVLSQTYGLDVTTDFSLSSFNEVPGLGGDPPIVANQLLSLQLPAGDARWFDLYVFGSNCSAGSYEDCSLMFNLFVGSQVCDPQGGGCVQLPAGALEGRASCPGGQTPGNELIVETCPGGGTSCSYQRGSRSQCWRAATPADPIISNAYRLGQQPASSSAWTQTTDASSPTTGVLYVPGDPANDVRAFSANFKRPAAPFITSESWNNACSSLDALTPNAPADGAISDPNITATLPTGPAGSRQCARTASVCIDARSTKIVDGEAVYRDCWAWQNTYTCAQLDNASNCSTLEQSGCQAQTAASCVVFDSNGRCLSAQRTYQCKTAEAVYAPATNCNNASFCAGGSCWDTTYQPNQNLAPAVAELQARMDAGKDFDPSNMRVFTGKSQYCSTHNFGATNCCNQGGGLITCDQQEKDTAVKKDKGLCHLVGDFCSHRVVLLGCATRQYQYCCYSGVLARVVQEQGHGQVGKSWGSPQNADCSGFTVNEFTSLNWSAIDLSEWYSQINPVPPALSSSQNQAQGVQNNCYYGNGKCGP